MLWIHRAQSSGSITSFDHCDDEDRCGQEYKPGGTNVNLFFYHNIDIKQSDSSVLDQDRNTLTRTAMSILSYTKVNWPIRLQHCCQLC